MACFLSPTRPSKTIAGLPFRIALIYLVLFSVAVVAYSTLWHEAPVKTNDSPGYLAVAQDLEDFHLDRLHLRPPGYPLLLLFTGSSRSPSRTLFFVSLLFHVVSIWLLGALLSAAGVSSRQLMAFALVLILPPFVEPSAFVMPENLIELLLVSGVAGFVIGTAHGKTSGLVKGAVAFAFSGLVHPTYQLLSVVVAACLGAMSYWCYWARLEVCKVISGASLLISTFAFLIGGCSLHNYLRFDYPGVTPFIGYTLSTKTVKVIERLPDDYGAVREALIAARDADLVKRGSSHTGYSYIWSAQRELLRLTGLDEVGLSTYLVRLNLLLIWKAPLHYLHEVVLAALGFWGPSSGALANLGSRVLQVLWGFIEIFLNTAFGIQLALVSSITPLLLGKRIEASADRNACNGLRTSRVRTLSYILGITTVLYAMTIVGLFGLGNARYRTPVESLIVFTAFLGCDMCERMARRFMLSASKSQVSKDERLTACDSPRRDVSNLFNRLKSTPSQAIAISPA